ncbi:MAG: DHH family phosphoesterase [Patescibacteria group bacterium]
MNILTSYHNPDLDGFASVYAYFELLQKFGTDVKIFFEGDLNLETTYLVKRLNLDLSYSLANGITIMDKIILLDTSQINELPRGIVLDQVVEIVDHHPITDDKYFTNAKKQIEMVGACASLVAERYHDRNIKPSLFANILLYCAIASNTLRLNSKITTDKDRKMFAWLESNNSNMTSYVDESFRAKSNLDGELLSKALLGDSAEKLFNGKKVIIFQIEAYDARVVAENRKAEILEIIKNFISESGNYDYAFLSLLDLRENCNVFIAINDESKALLTRLLNVTFLNGIAVRPGYIMRKELWVMIKNVLEIT